MIFVESQRCWEIRMVEERLRQDEAARKRRMGQLPRIEDDLLFFVKEHHEEVRNTSLAHRYARMRGYRNRRERDELIKEAFRHLTPLIRMGYLEWGRRNHVRLAPPEKHQAYLAHIDQMIAQHPKPNLTFGS